MNAMNEVARVPGTEEYHTWQPVFCAGDAVTGIFWGRRRSGIVQHVGRTTLTVRWDDGLHPQWCAPESVTHILPLPDME